MTIPALSEATIRSDSSSESYDRGRSYYDHGAVSNMVVRGNLLQGDVEGSQYTPYRARVTFDQGGVTSATCTCPYDWGGWCKHIVALLLACLYQSDAIEARPALDTQLAQLDRAQLQGLLLGLAERDSELADAIERQIALLRLADAAPRAREAGGQLRRSPIDQTAIRRQVQVAMQPPKRGRYDDYDYYDYDDEDPGGEVVEAVRPLLDQARGFLAGGDARSALAIMEAITIEYLAGCDALSDRLEEQQWEQTRPNLLKELRGSQAADAKVDVFLHEGLIDDAIASVKDGYSYGLLERVMDAAIPTRPEWVIKAASAQAERIIDAGDAQHYHHAVDWLRRAGAAYQAAGRPGDWFEYLRGIRVKHGRKCMLMGLIERL